MSEEIKPALTAEEWAGPEPITRKDVQVMLKMRGDGTCRLYLTDLWQPIDEERSLHALAALALHGQPYGFVWEDVDRLLAEAVEMEAPLEMEHRVLARSDSYFGALIHEHTRAGREDARNTLRLKIKQKRHLAARIAALLPPRGNLSQAVGDDGAYGASWLQLHPEYEAEQIRKNRRLNERLDALRPPRGEG